MKSRPSASLVRVDRRLSTALFRQVYQRIRNAVLDGTLAPGARLPSSRSLAGQLSIARGTIELAYALLTDEGYVAGKRRTGTIVNAGLSRKSMSPANARRSYGSRAELGHESVRPQPVRRFRWACRPSTSFRASSGRVSSHVGHADFPQSQWCPRIRLVTLRCVRRSANIWQLRAGSGVLQIKS